MKVMIDVKHMTDGDVADLWAMHRALAGGEAEETSAAEPDVAKAPAEATLADCRTALRDISETFGPNEVLNIVQSFEVSKISQLPEASYGDFVRACNKKLGMGA